MSSPIVPSTVALSALIEGFSRSGETLNEDFVRRFSGWFHTAAPRLRLSVVEQLALVDVVLTFHMRNRVKLVATGTLSDGSPGDVTVAVEEHDFPSVMVTIAEQPNPDPYEICTLDYSYAGRPVDVIDGSLNGQSGTIIVVATVGDVQKNRVRLESGEVVTLDGDVLEWGSLSSD